MTRLKSAAVSFLMVLGVGFAVFPSLAKVPADQANQLSGDELYGELIISSIAFGQGEACVDGNVVRILSRQDARNHEAVWQDRGHVLAAVDGDVDLARKQRVFYFFDEEALAANLGERRLLQSIA